MDDVRDLKVEKSGDSWKVFWPVNNATKLPPQVIAVNYLRWDVIGRGAGDEWGVQNADTPQVRILSMNAIQRPDSVVLVGEVVNEDSVPAFVNVGATLLDGSDNEIAQESSFDKIAHKLLPKQVSPYRIDFPGMRLEKIKNVRMDAKALLVAASADPVIEVNAAETRNRSAGQESFDRPIDRRERAGGGYSARDRRLLRRQWQSDLGIGWLSGAASTCRR